MEFQCRWPLFGEFTCQNAVLAERFIEAGSAYVSLSQKHCSSCLFASCCSASSMKEEPSLYIIYMMEYYSSPVSNVEFYTIHFAYYSFCIVA